jgi:hypothetical protein
VIDFFAGYLIGSATTYILLLFFIHRLATASEEIEGE